MELHVQTGILMLLVAAVVAMLTRRFRLPYSVGLMAAGIVLAALPFAPKITLTKDLVFTVLLPPLLFEASFSIQWNKLRRELLPIITLATLGVLFSAGVIAAGMRYLENWQWISALVFGALISATDPVSVVAIFKEARAHGRLLLLLEAESLLNDGTAAVAFAVVVALASGHGIAPLAIGVLLLKTILGGIVCGGAVALAALVLTGRTDDHLVEITFTTIAAYGSFLLADHFGFSGVLATITAGLVMGNFTAFNAFSQNGREAIRSFWEYATFIANSFVFLLIGMHESHQSIRAVWLPSLIAVALVLLGRALAIYPCSLLFSRSSLRITAKHQNVLFWGGLRGALALALALGLPPQVPLREEIITISFAVVAFSVFVQGSTIAPVLRKMGEIPARNEEPLRAHSQS